LGWDFVMQANNFHVIRELGWLCPVCQEGARHSIDKLKSDYANLTCIVLELQNKMRTFERSAAEATKTAFVENTVQASGNNASHGAINPTDRHSLDANKEQGQNAGKLWHQQDRTKSMVKISNSGYNITAIVAKTVKALQRKSQNVMVSDLAQKNSVEGDMELFVYICKNFLKLTPEVTSCKRLGQLGRLVSDNNDSHNNA